MGYDEDLADRVRAGLAGQKNLTERKMFGGLAFMVNGHMAVAVSDPEGLMVRVDPDDSEVLLRRAHTSRMVMSGRAMAGWLRVAPGGVRTSRQLRSWLEGSVAFVETLPAKRPR